MTEWGATMLLSHRHGRDPPTTPDLRAKNLKRFVPHMTYFLREITEKSIVTHGEAMSIFRQFGKNFTWQHVN